MTIGIPLFLSVMLSILTLTNVLSFVLEDYTDNKIYVNYPYLFNQKQVRTLARNWNQIQNPKRHFGLILLHNLKLSVQSLLYQYR